MIEFEKIKNLSKEEVDKEVLVWIISLSDPQVFDEAFLKEYNNTKTMKEAYEKLEKYYHWFFGKNRYSSFEAFYNSKYKRDCKKLGKG